MKGNQILTREDLASRFEEWASVIRAGKPIRASGRSVHVPERIQVGTELESKSGHVELEIEISWPASAIVAAQVANVCSTTIVQDAWRSGAELAVHGWIYSVGDGLLKDLEISVE
jgi:amphi-Trp domain-containing protein